MPPLVYGSLIAFICFITAVVLANHDNIPGMWLALFGVFAAIILTAYLQRKRESTFAKSQYNHFFIVIPPNCLFCLYIGQTFLIIIIKPKIVNLILDKHLILKIEQPTTMVKFR